MGRLRSVAVSLALAALAATAGCSGGGRALERLDQRSGITLLRGAAVLVFARTEPRYSRSARDYVYVGPVETNRQGVREYYLWVGVGTTLDRGFLAPGMGEPRMLYIDVAGEPMELPLRSWTTLVPTSFDAPIYPTAVPVADEFAARVTLQQLELIDAERPIAVSVAGEDGAPRRYVRWDDDATFAAFLAVAGGATSSVE
jgi:hypothetical protein